ncbi:MAG TPA: sigma-70 family RNA polymerase sigma factor, partial [Planctomycetaceae bacterium]|nr:sigma-70 family RNA polymerase sigma factor [Planctomycetaceae bacterium]
LMATSNDWPSTRESLIEQMQAEPNGPAWGLFAEVYVPLIYRFCRRRGFQDADANDVTNNVFLAVHRGFRTFRYDPERGRFRGWLGTVTRNELTRLKPPKNPLPPDLPDFDADWIVACNTHLLQLALERIRPEFSELTWQAFDLVWLQSHKAAAVAAQLGRSSHWVHQAQFRVLRRLEREVRFLMDDMPGFDRDR